MNQNQNKSIGTRAKEKIQSLFREPKTEAGRIRRRIAGRVGITSLAVLMIGAILFALTSAWYTNTIQANEITLKTAKWNFDGTITLDGEDNKGTLDLGDLYPGDTRPLPVTIVNQDTRGVNVRVEADKSKMASPEMQQRLYLYVEVTDEATNTKTRHYINSLSGYLYTVAAKQTLHITDAETLSANEVQNKNTLHLQWVYDMTGYFLLGTVTEKGSTITVAGKTEDTQPEYLMPVTYDLDRAQFDTDGKLHSVSEYQTNTNGTAGYATTSREDYLKRLFEQYISGYNSNAKPYDDKTTIRGNYYAVDVDATGYGVWLYLPDQDAIKKAEEWDMSAAKNMETAQPISLNLVFKGQNQPTTTTGKEQQP